MRGGVGEAWSDMWGEGVKFLLTQEERSGCFPSIVAIRRCESKIWRGKKKQDERGGVLAMYHRYQALCEKEEVMGVGSLLGSSSREGEGEVQLPSGRQRLDGQIIGETTKSKSSICAFFTCMSVFVFLLETFPVSVLCVSVSCGTVPHNRERERERTQTRHADTQNTQHSERDANMSSSSLCLTFAFFSLDLVRLFLSFSSLFLSLCCVSATRTCGVDRCLRECARPRARGTCGSAEAAALGVSDS